LEHAPTAVSLARSALIQGSLALAIASWSAFASADTDVDGDRLLPAGTFLAPDGRTRDLRQTHDDGLRPMAKNPHYLRALLEQFIIIAGAEVMYWAHPSIDKSDWDFPSGKQRLDNLKPSFDDNLHVTNDIMHPIVAGNLYYWAARENGLSIPVSLLYSAATGAFYEFIAEWLERASINDLIMTPFGAWAPGEFQTQLSDYLNSAPNPKWGHYVAAWTLGIGHRIHRPGGWQPNDPMPPDNLGFSSYFWHRFFIGGSATLLTNDLDRQNWLYGWRIEADLASIPGFLRPGRFVLPFHEGEFNTFRFAGALGSHNDQTWDVDYIANLAGRYEQNISRGGVGYATMLAVQTAYDFADRYRLGRHEAWALAHIIGPAARVWGVYHDLVANLEVAVSPDFTVIQSQVWPDWAAQFGPEGQKTELQAHGYYFAYGVTPRLRGAIEYHGIELAGRYKYGWYESIDCCDRFQENVTRNTHNSDRISEVEAWLQVKIPSTPLAVQARTLHTYHSSRIPPLSVSTWDHQYGAVVGLVF
jgi:hypothetical protein